MSYDLFIVDKDVPEPEWFDVCERDGEHVRTGAHGRYFNYTYNLSAFFTDYKVHPKHDLAVVTADGVNRTGCKHFDLHNPGQKEMDLEH